MAKTTVYLPTSLKERLRRLATREQRSEASLIREAIERIVDSRPPRPRIPLVGPGEVEPVTDWESALEGFGQD